MKALRLLPLLGLLCASCATTEEMNQRPYVEREYQTGTSIPRTSGTRFVSDTKDADPDAVKRALEQQTLAPNDPTTRSEMKLPPR